MRVASHIFCFYFMGDSLICSSDQLLERDKGPLRMCAGKRDYVTAL